MPNDTVMKKLVGNIVSQKLGDTLVGFETRVIKAVQAENKKLRGEVTLMIQKLHKNVSQMNNKLWSDVTKTSNSLLTGVAQMRDEIITSNDKVAGELKTLREEQTLLNGRTVKINEIENRVEKLEEIHHHGPHASV